jgi:hypothetical protein
MDDYTAVGIAEGFIEADNAVEFFAAWQHLHDSRLAYSLQGFFGRTATRLIEEGLINA